MRISLIKASLEFTVFLRGLNTFNARNLDLRHPEMEIVYFVYSLQGGGAEVLARLETDPGLARAVDREHEVREGGEVA